MASVWVFGRFFSGRSIGDVRASSIDYERFSLLSFGVYLSNIYNFENDISYFLVFILTFDWNLNEIIKTQDLSFLQSIRTLLYDLAVFYNLVAFIFIEQIVFWCWENSLKLLLVHFKKGKVHPVEFFFRHRYFLSGEDIRFVDFCNFFENLIAE